MADSDSVVWLSKPGLAGKLVHGKFFPLVARDGRALVVGTKDLPAKIIPRPNNGAWILEGGIFEEIGRGPNRWRHLSANGVLTEPRPFPWPQLNFAYHAPTLDHAGNLWLYVSGIGLAKFSPDGQRYEVYGKNEGLNENEVMDVFEDRQENIWVWGRTGGVNRLRKPLFATLDSRNGLRTDNVYSLSRARDGGVWIGTHNSGAYLWRQGQLYIHRKAKNHSWAVLEDSSGSLWNGTYGWGLRRFGGGNEDVIQSSEAGKHGHTLALFEDSSGRVWLGGQHGLSAYDKATGAVKTYVPPLFDRSYPDWVISLAEDRKGAIWLGTRRGFLHRLEKDEFKTFLVREGDPTHAVCSLHFLQPDDLWFARFGSGISRLKDGHLNHFSVADGLPTSTINGMLDDGRGYLWMTSKQGVYRISKTEFAAFAQHKRRAFNWQRFTRKDGLPSDECHGEQNQPTLCQTSDGRIWITTVGGIGIIDPSTLPSDVPAAPVVEQVQVFRKGNEAVTLLADGEFDAAKPAAVTVPPGMNNLVIRYTAIDLANPKKVNFKYRVTGLDSDWVDAKNGRTAIYAALPPGAYHFELATINDHGTRSAPVRVGLRVLPFWWETWIFRGAVGALFLLSGPAYMMHRVRSLQRRQRAQANFSRQLIEREEAERKRVAQEVHDVLGHELLLLKNRAVQGAQRAGAGSPLQSEFEQISSTATRALQETRDISHRLRPIELDRLGLSHALEALLATTSASTGLRVFKELDDLDPQVPVELQLHLYRLVQEGLSNVLKHARASTVTIEIKKDGDHLRLQLQDDGAGYDPAVIAQTRAGLGLTGMEERVQLVGGQFQISSAPGRGTRIQVSIPLARASG